MSSVRSTQRQLKLVLRFTLLTILCLVAGLLLTACQSEADVSVKVGDDPTIQSNPATATPLPILVATPLPTATPVPTATPRPTPTPTPEPPKPSAIILGDKDNPALEITRYQMQPNVELQPINLAPSLLTGLNSWMTVTSVLAPLEGATPNLYQLVFKEGWQNPELVKSLAVEDGFRAMVRGAGGKFISQGTLLKVAGGIKPAALAFTVVSIIASYMYMDELNKKFEEVNKNIQEVKSLIQADRFSRLQGDMNYMDGIRKALNEQSLTPDEVGRYRDQLETIERESQGDLEFYKARMNDETEKFRNVKLDKSLFFFRDEDKVNELKQIVDDFSHDSSSYFLVLSVRSMSAQLSCALPQSRQTALDRVQNVRDRLPEWLQQQTDFYNLVLSRVPEMNGLFADSKTRDNFNDTAKRNWQTANDTKNKADGELNQIVQQLQNQIKQGATPVSLVVEVDKSGNIVKVSRLVN